MDSNNKTKGKKYEYLEVLYLSYTRCRLIVNDRVHPELEYTINQLGGMGFELVIFYSKGGAHPIAIFKREYDEERSNAEEICGYECEHCGYKQEVNFIFCPKCKKNDEGKIEVASC